MDPVYILLVEDDQDDIELLLTAFKDAQIPFHMDSVMQGDAVIPFLTTRSRQPDVIVLDLNMPGIHGREVLQLLKASGTLQNIPVVMLTTSSSLADLEFCKKAGAEAFLTKPLTVAGFHSITQAIFTVAAGN